MSPDLRGQIHTSLDLKETDELLEIWQENNRADWSDLAFEVLAEILQQRLGELPPQDEPVHTHAGAEGDQDDTGDGSPDDDNAPVFYKPQTVLRLADWLGYAAIAYLVIAIATNLLQFSRIQQSISPFFVRAPQFEFLSFWITLAVMGVDIVIAVVVLYLPLKAAAEVLKILLEMEFNSRQVK